MDDCFKEKSIGPLFLALYVYRARTHEFNSNLTVVTGQKEIIQAFNVFKQSLINNKVLSRNFFWKVFLKNQEIKNFYDLNLSSRIKKL